MRFSIPSFALLVSTLVACGGGGEVPAGADADPASTPDGGVGVPDATPVATSDAAVPSAQSYVPLAVGTIWTYRITDPVAMTVTQKSTTVEALEDVGGLKPGIMAFRVRTDKATGGYTLSWQSYVGATMERHREQSYGTAGTMKSEDYYEPFKLVIDESAPHTAMGAAYMESYTDAHLKVSTNTTTTLPVIEEWSVVAVAESVTVPAGTYACLHLHRLESGTATTKELWFAAGVGKIKELSSSGRVEELVSYTP